MIGIATPIAFLRSKQSQGIGDIEDLKLLIDWCVDNNLEIIQLLPILDTGPEASPYSAISSVALNPIYLRLPQATPFLNYLNQQDRVCYISVYNEKMRLLKEIDFPEVKPEFLEQFPSLKEYAVYKTLKEENQYHSHEEFFLEPFELEKILQESDQDFLKQVDFHLRIQQHLFHQWKALRSYAFEKGVFLMGDLPILVSRESHEVYFHPELFHLDFEAGAPPDDFAPQGQNWGQPIYNWEAHEKTGYSFFLQRLKILEQIFDYYRIDHTIGFFRFWKIPKNEKGSKGKFSSEIPEEYLPKAFERLSVLLNGTTLRPIAEDLGTKPEGMEELLKELHIPGIKVMRWEEDLDSIPVESLSTISLHDTSLSAYWFRQENGREIGDEERHTLMRSILQTPSLFKINLLQEYFALEQSNRYPFDELEQINIPSTILPTNWTIRMQKFLEEIQSNTALATKIRSLLESGYDH